MTQIFEQYFFLMVVYSFAGWVWESLFCSLIWEKKLINRGFLNGPYCPIYGFGAIIGLLFFSDVENTVVLFFSSAIMTCTLEYLTSWAMEKLFHARWWDYSDEPLNINGRVYIGGFLAFGFAIVMLVRYINPFVTGLMMKIPDRVFDGICAFLFAGIVFDIVITVAGLAGFDDRLREITAALETARETVTDKIQSNPAYEAMTSKIQSTAAYEKLHSGAELVADKIQSGREAVADRIQSAPSAHDAVLGVFERVYSGLSHQQKRVMRAFPKLRSIRYERAFNELKKFSVFKKSHKNTEENAKRDK